MEKKKSPAVNFYTSDFLTGTTFMSNQQVGAYIRLLSYQHQLGHLTEEIVNKVLYDLSDEKKHEILDKFLIDKNGKYFNKRMEEETIKKRKYSESRANNRKKKDNTSKTYENDMNNISKTYEEHMEIENDNDNNNYKIFSYIESNFNITINGNNYELILEYLKQFNDEILCYAVDKTIANGANTLSYFFTILQSWSQKKYKTLKEIKERDVKPLKNKAEHKETIEEKFERLKREGQI